MSSPISFPTGPPLIALVDRANRALQADMVREARERGYSQVKQAHNVVFSTLGAGGARASDLAALAGITRQSMGEIIRELVGLGILTTERDPTDARAKLITYTEDGLDLTSGGYRHIIEQEEHFARELGAQEYEIVRTGLDRIADLLAARGQ